MDQVLEEIRAFVAARDWEQYHDPKNLAMAVVSEAGELAAELRWVANDDADTWCREAANHGRVRDEIADVAITLTMLADRIGVDLAEAMRDKLVKNAAKYPVDRWKGKHE